MSTIEQNSSIPHPTPSTPARMAETRFNDSVQPPLLPVPEGSEAENERIPTPTQDAQSTQIKGTGQMSVATSKITWRSAKSRFSSLYSRSIGKQSLNGATWRQNLATTLNSGFGQGGLRGDGYRGPSEGRERGGYLPSVTGVGRIGKGPAAVPEALIQALRQSTGIEQRKRKAITRKMDEEIRRRTWSGATVEEEEARQQLHVFDEGLWLIQEIIRLCERAGSSEVEVVQHLKEIRERFDDVLLDIGVSHDQLMFTTLPYQEYPGDNTSVSDNWDLLKKIIEQVDFSERYFAIIMSILSDTWVLRQKIPGARDGPFRAEPPPNIWRENAYMGWIFGEGGPVEQGLVVTPSEEELEKYLEAEEKRSITLVSHMQLRTAKMKLEDHLRFLDELLDIREHHPSPFVQHAILLTAGAVQPEARKGWLLFWIVTSKAWRTAPVLKALRYAEMFQDVERRWAQIVDKCPEAAFSLQDRDVEKMHQRAMHHAGLSDSPRYQNFSEVQEDGPYKGQEWWFLEDVDTHQRKDIL